MTKPEKFTNKHLSIEVVEHATAIDVKWEGRSIDRDPGKFISPILIKVLEMAGAMNKRIFIGPKRA